MDTSIEGFFYKREYNLQNFNFLLQVLAEKKDKKGALSAFEKMKVRPQTSKGLLQIFGLGAWDYTYTKNLYSTVDCLRKRPRCSAI